MERSFTFSRVLSLMCLVAYFVSGYAIKGDHWLDLVFLVMVVLSSIFHQKLDELWEEWRSKH